MPPPLCSQAHAGVDKDIPTRETIIKRFSFITSPRGTKNSNPRVGGEYHFWVTSGDLRLKTRLRQLPSKVTFIQNGVRSFLPLAQRLEVAVFGWDSVAPVEMERGFAVCFLGAWARAEERLDVTEKRGLEGGAEMVSGDIEDALSVLYLSY